MLWHPALSVFRPLPLRERLFVMARHCSAPLEEMASRVEGFRILDVGCGHGLLCSMLAHGFPRRSVVGIDVDSKKIDWARRSVGRLSNTRFERMTVDRLASLEPQSFDAITVADVLYLLPPGDWPGFLKSCHRLLQPGGQLLIKEAEDDGGWRTRKAMLQEQVMVRWLRRTRHSGGLGFLSREKMREILSSAGFEISSVESLAKWSSTPHVLFVAECG